MTGLDGCSLDPSNKASSALQPLPLPLPTVLPLEMWASFALTALSPSRLLLKSSWGSLPSFWILPDLCLSGSLSLSRLSQVLEDGTCSFKVMPGWGIPPQGCRQPPSSLTTHFSLELKQASYSLSYLWIHLTDMVFRFWFDQTCLQGIQIYCNTVLLSLSWFSNRERFYLFVNCI